MHDVRRAISGVLLTVAMTATAQAAPWDAYNLAPATRTLGPVSVFKTNGSVVNPNNVLTGQATAIVGSGAYITLDFGYSYIWFKDAPIRVGPGHPDQTKLITLIPGVFNSYGADVRTNVQVISLAIRKEFLPDVIVTKY